MCVCVNVKERVRDQTESYVSKWSLFLLEGREGESHSWTRGTESTESSTEREKEDRLVRIGDER